MSYILDALKKSEQERGHGNIPDVQTVHSSSLNYREDKQIVWPYILIAAVILNLFAITYFIINKEEHVSNQVMTAVTQTVSTDKSDKSIVANKLEQQPKLQPSSQPNSQLDPLLNQRSKQQFNQLNNTTRAVDSNAVKQAIIKAASPIDTPVKYLDNSESNDAETNRQTTDYSTALVDFHELPESIKRQIPTIIISAHVYSSNPLQRSIVINNNFMEEGEYVLDDLILYEITADGAVFNFQGTLFNYGVISGWQ